jgi:hypothetical protein
MLALAHQSSDESKLQVSNIVCAVGFCVGVARDRFFSSVTRLAARC